MYFIIIISLSLSLSLSPRPIVYANMSTQPINVTRAQSGFLFFKSDRTVSIIKIISLFLTLTYPHLK